MLKCRGVVVSTPSTSDVPTFPRSLFGMRIRRSPVGVLETTSLSRFMNAGNDRNHKLLDATVTLLGSTIRRDPASARLVGVIRVDVFSSEKRSEIMRRI